MKTPVGDGLPALGAFLFRHGREFLNSSESHPVFQPINGLQPGLQDGSIADGARAVLILSRDETKLSPAQAQHASPAKSGYGVDAWLLGNLRALPPSQRALRRAPHRRICAARRTSCIRRPAARIRR